MRRLARIAVGVLAGASAAAVAWGGLHRRAITAAAEPVSAREAWPESDAPLRIAPVAYPEGFGRRRVYLDPGHGAPNNTGNVSSFCIDEETFTLWLADEVAARLEATGHFEVRVSRDALERVTYPDRIADASAWGAEALISLHSDVRGRVQHWAPEPGRNCPLSLEAPGFSVLVSDEGDASIVGARLGLARSVARALEGAGVPPYGGLEYEGLYEADAAGHGVFVDRHALEKRIYILRNAEMPAVLVETHNALDAREATRWTEPRTIDAFTAALARALLESLPR